MVVQLGFLRDALIEAGASEAKAGKAAEELAGYENEFASVRSDIAAFRADTKTEFGVVRGEIAALRGETKAEFAAVRGDINLLRWMTASVFALLLAVALKIFLH